MKQRSIIFVSFALLAIAGIAAWKLVPGRGREQALPVDETPGSSASTSAALPLPTHGQPLPPGTFDQTRAELERRARRGDGNAAYRLADVTAKCLTYEPISENVLVEKLASAITTSAISLGGRPLGDDTNIDLILFAHGEMERTCAGTDDLRQHPSQESAFHWMEIAARAGHPKAMAEFGTQAFTEFKSTHDLVEQAALVNTRRNLAAGYLRSALAANEPTALFEAAKANGDGFLADDPEAALTYWLAYRQHPSFAWPETIASRLEAQYLQQVPASSRVDIERRASQLLQRPSWSVE